MVLNATMAKYHLSINRGEERSSMERGSSFLTKDDLPVSIYIMDKWISTN